VVFRGRLMDRITQEALRECERRLGFELTIVQGCYQADDGHENDVEASAGTHDGGGVVDLAPLHWEDKVRVARRVGFAAWHRLPSEGPWDEHVHMVLIGNKLLSSAARDQVADYLAHPPRNGLKSNLIDDTPHPNPPVVFTMMRPRWRGRRIEAAIAALRKARGKGKRGAAITAALKALVGIEKL
jgi:hypothetical protein